MPTVSPVSSAFANFLSNSLNFIGSGTNVANIAGSTAATDMPALLQGTSIVANGVQLGATALSVFQDLSPMLATAIAKANVGAQGLALVTDLSTLEQQASSNNGVVSNQTILAVLGDISALGSTGFFAAVAEMATTGATTLTLSTGIVLSAPVALSLAAAAGGSALLLGACSLTQNSFCESALQSVQGYLAPISSFFADIAVAVLNGGAFNLGGSDSFALDYTSSASLRPIFTYSLNGITTTLQYAGSGSATRNITDTTTYTNSNKTVVSSETETVIDAATGLTTATTINYNPGGGQCTFTTDTFNTIAPAVILGAASGTETPSGILQSLNVSGSLGTISTSNTSIVVANGATAAIAGSDDTVQAGAGGTLSVSGNGQLASAANADTVTFATGTTGVVNVSANSTAYVNGSGVTVNSAAGTELLSGSNNTLNVTGVGYATLVGSGDLANASSSTFWLAGGQSTTFNGNGNSIGVSTNDVTNISGGTNTVFVNGAASGGTINLSNTGAGADTLTLAGATGIMVNLINSNTDVSLQANSTGVSFTSVNGGGVVNTATGDSTNFWGNGLTINANGALSCAIVGSNDTANATNSKFWFGTNLSTTINGANNYFGIGANDVLQLSGGGNSVGINNSANGSTIDAASTGSSTDSINLAGASGVMVNLENANTNVSLQANSTGVNFTSANGGGVINTSAGDSTAFIGNGLTINASGALSCAIVGTNDTANATGSKFWFGNNLGSTINGANNYFGIGANDVLQLSGGGNSVGINNSANGSTIDASSTGTSTDSINLTGATGVMVNLENSNTNVSLQANSTGVNFTSANGGGVVNTTAGDSTAFFGNGLTINAAGALSCAIIGSGDIANATGSKFWLGSNLSATFNGANDYCGVGSNDVLRLSGGGNTVGINGSANGATIDLSNTGSSADALSLSGATGVKVNLDTYVDAGVVGPNVVIDCSNGDILTATNDRINVGGNTSMVLYGKMDTLVSLAADSAVLENLAGGGSVVYSWLANGSETIVDYTGYNATGAVDGSSGGYYGYFGVSGSKGTGAVVSGTSIDEIAAQDEQHGLWSAADAAQVGLNQAYRASQAPAAAAGLSSAAISGRRWGQAVITWSLAQTAGPAGAPFSSYMGASYTAQVQAAFNVWAAQMPGVQFVQVADSASSDIRFGFGDFDTANTGVVGYTSYKASGSSISAGAIIRLEDPTQDALQGTGQTYGGTDATQSQTMVHEIGHALGLGDSSDPNSIMYYDLTSNNTSLDLTDTEAIQSLYGAPAAVPNTTSAVQKLVDAMGSFGVSASFISGLTDHAAGVTVMATGHLTGSYDLKPDRVAHAA